MNIYIRKIWPLAVIAFALALGSATDVYAKNSPVYPQFQNNGGTAYAAGSKDGGGGGIDVSRMGAGSHKSGDSRLVPTTKYDAYSRYELKSWFFDPFAYFTQNLDYYFMLIDLKFESPKTHPVHPYRH